MARYYTTPTLFDTMNTREIPSAAAKLLVRGQALDRSMLPLDLPAPVNELFTRLSVRLPVDDVRARAPEYCAAVLEVRERVPQARAIFRDVRRRGELSPLTDEVGRLFEAELARQQRVRRTGGWTLTVGTALAGTLIGQAAGAELAESVGAGLATGLGGRLIETGANDARQRRRRPWLLASEIIEDRIYR